MAAIKGVRMLVAGCGWSGCHRGCPGFQMTFFLKRGHSNFPLRLENDRQTGTRNAFGMSFGPKRIGFQNLNFP
jgi:hypothetical protein